MRNKDIIKLKEKLEEKVEENKNDKEFIGIYYNVETEETNPDIDTIVITTVFDGKEKGLDSKKKKSKLYDAHQRLYEMGQKEYVEYGEHLRIKFQEIQIARMFENAIWNNVDGKNSFPGREERERNNILNAIIIYDKNEDIKQAQIMTKDADVLKNKQKQTSTVKKLVRRFKNVDWLPKSK